MTDLKLIKPGRLPKDNEFVWRYIDIHRFLNLIKQKHFRFTRMDQFEDALEGIPFETLQQLSFINSRSEVNLANIIIEPNRYLLIGGSSPFGRIEHILRIQASQFVSCWFYEQRESMAMWNLYSNSDGVALKVPFGKLKEYLLPSLKGIEIDEYYCGKVEYQDFKTTSPYAENAPAKIGKVALRKDTSFSHEKEIRFVIRTRDKTNLITGINSKPITLKDLEMKIVCHPRMEKWKKENVNQILKNSKLSSSFSDSEITLRY